MRKLLLRWLINAIALFAAERLVAGIDVAGEVEILLIVALIFGLVNALIRPFLKILSCPLVLLTLGLFTLVINATMLWLTSWLANQVGVGFYVEGFMPAFWGGLVITLVSLALSILLKEKK